MSCLQSAIIPEVPNHQRLYSRRFEEVRKQTLTARLRKRKTFNHEVKLNSSAPSSWVISRQLQRSRDPAGHGNEDVNRFQVCSLSAEHLINVHATESVGVGEEVFGPIRFCRVAEILWTE